jgi:cytochrome b561
MSDAKSTARYGAVSIGLHWLTLLLFVGVYATIELREVFPKGSVPRNSLKEWHFMLGLSIFVLAWLRVTARIAWPAPRHEGAGRLLAGVVHLSLYALMIGMPIAGWLILSAEGKPIPFFGLELPPLTSPNAALGHQVEELHELVGTIGYFLIGLHALAGLAHHYVLHDNVLVRMLPARS